MGYKESNQTNKQKKNLSGVSNSLDPDQAQQNVEPDLGPNCLQRLSADNTSKQRVTYSLSCQYFCHKNAI